MALPLNLLANSAHWTRKSAVVLSAATPFTEAVTRTSPVPIHLLMSAPNAVGSVSVAVTGSLDGVSVNETLVIQNSIGFARSLQRWDTLTQLSTTTPDGGTVEVKTVFGSGQEATLDATVNSALRGRLWQARIPTLPVEAAGPTQKVRLRFVTNDLTVAVGDRLFIDGVTYEVENAITQYDAKRAHHRACVVHHQEGRAA